MWDHPSLYANFTWTTGADRVLRWQDMSAQHLMNVVRYIDRTYSRRVCSECGEPTTQARYYRHIAMKMHRYVAWRERAHA